MVKDRVIKNMNNYNLYYIKITLARLKLEDKYVLYWLYVLLN